MTQKLNTECEWCDCHAFCQLIDGEYICQQCFFNMIDEVSEK